LDITMERGEDTVEKPLRSALQDKHLAVREDDSAGRGILTGLERGEDGQDQIRFQQKIRARNTIFGKGKWTWRTPRHDHRTRQKQLEGASWNEVTE